MDTETPFTITDDESGVETWENWETDHKNSTTLAYNYYSDCELIDDDDFSDIKPHQIYMCSDTSGDESSCTETTEDETENYFEKTVNNVKVIFTVKKMNSNLSLK